MQGQWFISKTFFQSLGASFFLGLASYGSLNFLSPILGTSTFWGIFFQGLISGIVGIAVGVSMLYLLKNDEIVEIVATLKTKFWRTDALASPQEEL